VPLNHYNINYSNYSLCLEFTVHAISQNPTLFTILLFMN